MKIKVTEKCNAFSCYIDDKEMSEFSTEELRTIVHKLVDMCDRDNLESLIWIYQNMLEITKIIAISVMVPL